MVNSSQRTGMDIAVFQVLYPKDERAAERLGRRYVIGLEKARLTVHRSGPTRPPSAYVERFETHDALIANLQEKLKRRFRNGYVLIWWSDGFPLLEWIRERAYPIEYHPALPPAMQLELPCIDWSSEL